MPVSSFGYDVFGLFGRPTLNRNLLAGIDGFFPNEGVVLCEILLPWAKNILRMCNNVAKM